MPTAETKRAGDVRQTRHPALTTNGKVLPMAAIENRSVKVYVFAEHSSMKGRVATPADLDRLTDPATGRVSDDVFLWGHDTSANLIVLARNELARHRDTGARGAFIRTCARNALATLGAPEAPSVAQAIANASPAALARILDATIDDAPPDHVVTDAHGQRWIVGPGTAEPLDD